jgi:putative N6-adenine-specific DNA methylase
MPLLDPFCGSGTIAIEAALLASGRAPGAARSFAFQRWSTFEPGTWASVRAEIDNASAAAAGPTIIHATDRDHGAIDVARENAANAGVDQLVMIERATISDLVAPASTDEPGWLISNPPYGRRVSAGKDLRDLFAALGNTVRVAIPGWNVGVLASDLRSVAHARLEWTERFETDNGGVRVQYVTAPVRVAS